MALLTGIDPGTCSIKVVQGQMSGPIFKLTRVLSIPIDPEEDREVEILQALQAELPSYKLKQAKTRLGVTGRDLMIRYTNVPPVPLWRLKMLMDFEIQDMSSSSGDELVADYNLLTAGDDDGDEKVLVSLVKSHFHEARLRALKGGGLDVFSATPNCVAVFNAFLAFGDLNDDEYTFLLDIGDRNLEMAVQKDGELVFSRNVSGGGEMFTKAIAETWNVSDGKARELKHDYGNVAPRGRASYGSSQEEKVANATIGVAGQLSGMVQSTMNFARTQSGIRDMEIGRILISGGGAALEGLDEYLAQNLRVPVQRFVPENALDLSALKPEDLETFDEDPSAFVCALGLARMSEDPDAFTIDLVPAAVKKRRDFQSRTLYMVLAGAVAALFLGVLWFDLSGRLSESSDAKDKARREERREVQRRRRFEEKGERAELMRAKVDRLAWESRAGTYLVRGQRLVQQSAPASVWIASVDVGPRSVSPPGKESDRKAQMTKTIVTVRGEIRQLGEGVTSTFNRFVESIRSGEGAPVVTMVERPADAGGDFVLTLDFAGWDAQPEEEDDDWGDDA